MIKINNSSSSCSSFIFPACAFGGGAGRIHIEGSIIDRFAFRDRRRLHTRACSSRHHEFETRMCVALAAYIITFIGEALGMQTRARVPRFSPVGAPVTGSWPPVGALSGHVLPEWAAAGRISPSAGAVARFPPPPGTRRGVRRCGSFQAQEEEVRVGLGPLRP